MRVARKFAHPLLNEEKHLKRTLVKSEGKISQKFTQTDTSNGLPVDVRIWLASAMRQRNKNRAFRAHSLVCPSIVIYNNHNIMTIMAIEELIEELNVCILHIRCPCVMPQSASAYSVAHANTCVQSMNNVLPPIAAFYTRYCTFEHRKS